MMNSRESLTIRLSFLLVCMLATISLIVLLAVLIPKNVSFGLSNTEEQNSVGGWQAIDTVAVNVGGVVWGATTAVAHGIGTGVSSSVHAVAIFPGNLARSTTRFAKSATDFRGFIRPSERSHTVVITPVAVAVAAKQVSTTPQVKSAQVVATGIKAGSVPAASQPTGNNFYAWGNCTWWVAKRRAQIGSPIPNRWGNANAWANSARRSGYLVDHTPSPGAIMQTPYAAGGYGHVALVERVDTDGTWHISEMNAVGFNVVSYRALPPAKATSYSFIH